MTGPVGQHSAPEQRDATPTAKVAQGALTGSLVTVLISVAKSFGWELEPEVAASLVTLASFIAAYYKRSRSGEIDL